MVAATGSRADADFSVVSALQERRTEFPTVHIEMRPRRRYFGGEAAGHILGYVGEITADELASTDFSPDLYEQGMVVEKRVWRSNMNRSSGGEVSNTLK
ncbi:MAG: hypothetical protein CM1200mP14_09370 [Gammaproteobacteria bacterium]|nr:MAG: hypothetical protein CM1200mP14_09370 [Gammaproteobacteria bacterium]